MFHFIQREFNYTGQTFTLSNEVIKSSGLLNFNPTDAKHERGWTSGSCLTLIKIRVFKAFIL